MSMASSAQNLQGGGATSAPPPTPSVQLQSSTAEAADALSRLLHLHLPPSLSLPTRRSSAAAAAATCPVIASLSEENAGALLASASEHGFFQVEEHSVTSELALSAESEALSLFNLSPEEKESRFPNHNWPLGYDDTAHSFCLDSGEPSTPPGLGSLTRELERVGLRIVELLSGSVGFETPKRLCTLTWVSEELAGKKPESWGGFYPYVVGLQYQIRRQKYSLVGDSGWVAVSPGVDSVLVTIGDIAQVWSNGQLKKVRGRAVPSSSGDDEISVSVLITLLPLESTTLSPLILPKHQSNTLHLQQQEEEISDEKWLFKSFSFEDYAWRVYHDRFSLKDPLQRYRIQN